MARIISAHFNDLNGALLQQALAYFYRIRSLPDLQKKPSTSELIDWLRALIIGGVSLNAIEDEIPYAGVKIKEEDNAASAKVLFEKLSAAGII